MTQPTNPTSGSTEPIAGDPLIAAPDPSEVVEASAMEPPDPERTSPAVDPPPVAPAAPSENGGGKVKTAAVVAGAAALANKLRKEAPKMINQLRDRLVGRCVIITEVDGRFLAIGPYKNEDAARDDAFKVGGTPHVAELISDTAYFAPPEQS